MTKVTIQHSAKRKLVQPKVSFPITEGNYQNHKISDFIESVLYDIDRVIASRCRINMDLYVHMGDKVSDCMVCLGSIALLGFEEKITIEAIKKVDCESNLSEKFKIATLFNHFRNMDVYYFSETIYEIFQPYPEISNDLWKKLKILMEFEGPFKGFIKYWEVIRLKNFIKEVVRLFHQYDL